MTNFTSISLNLITASLFFYLGQTLPCHFVKRGSALVCIFGFCLFHIFLRFLKVCMCNKTIVGENTKDWIENRSQQIIQSHHTHIWWCKIINERDKRTHWPLGDVAMILQVEISNLLYRMVAWSLAMKLLSVWMPQNLTDKKSTLVQVMAWRRQIASHFLSQSWPRSMSLDNNELITNSLVWCNFSANKSPLGWGFINLICTCSGDISSTSN